MPRKQRGRAIEGPGKYWYPTRLSPAEAITRLKSSVYVIARGRDQGGQTQWVTLGSGFICGEKRLITCAHVIEDPSNQNPMPRLIRMLTSTSSSITTNKITGSISSAISQRALI